MKRGREFSSDHYLSQERASRCPGARPRQGAQEDTGAGLGAPRFCSSLLPSRFRHRFSYAECPVPP